MSGDDPASILTPELSGAECKREQRRHTGEQIEGLR